MTARTTESTVARPRWLRTWGGGVVAGLVAGVGMGLVIQFGAGTMALVGALYGFPTVFAGWVAHLFHSVVFALVFVAVVVLFPRGIWGLFEDVASAVRRLGGGR